MRRWLSKLTTPGAHQAARSASRRTDEECTTPVRVTASAVTLVAFEARRGDRHGRDAAPSRGSGSPGNLRRQPAYAGAAAVRAAVSSAFPVIFRYSQWKSDVYDARLAETPQRLEAILVPLAAAGVDAFHASTRRYWQPEFDGSDLNLAGWTKKLTGKPTITVGSVGLDGDFIRSFAGEGFATQGIDDLLDRLERDEFDMVAVGRTLLQDPEWAAKVLTGRFDELAPYDPAALRKLS
jgi:hypothetical protein